MPRQLIPRALFAALPLAAAAREIRLGIVFFASG